MTLKIVYEPKQAQGFIEDCNGVFKDCEVPLHMILIPSGTFTMGSRSGLFAKAGERDLEWGQVSEKPNHQVSVPQFFMGRYPITQVQWKKIAEFKQIKLRLNPDCSKFKGDDRPVENVSWYEAIEFCARLSRQTGRNYRLPSEAEWEYACRAGTITHFHFGETISTELANYDGRSSYGGGETGIYRAETTDVTSFKVANAFGLSDMHGNVWEWCLDPWNDNYDDAPTDGRVWDKRNEHNSLYQNALNTINAKMWEWDSRARILRGGSLNDSPTDCRSRNRHASWQKSQFSFRGFRVVASHIS